MPAMTTAEKTEAASLRAAFETAKNAVQAVLVECANAKDLARTNPTSDKLMGEAYIAEAKGIANVALGYLTQGHAALAKGALIYSAADGQTIIMGGSRR